MNFVCQNIALRELNKLAGGNRHSILIEGVVGSGKTYLAKQYSSMLNILDFQVLEPTVQTIKTAIEECYKVNNPVVLCIENLDIGVPAASYTLLKFLEEPADNIYIIITCRSINYIPDTIISRSVCVTTSPPVDADLTAYAKSRDDTKYLTLCSTDLWRCVRTFKDVDTVLNLTSTQLSYFSSLSNIMKFNDTISNMLWTLGHYPDNSETPVELVIRYVIQLSDNIHIRQAGIECISALTSGRIASHAIIAKFLFECKYCTD